MSVRSTVLTVPISSLILNVVGGTRYEIRARSILNPALEFNQGKNGKVDLSLSLTSKFRKLRRMDIINLPQALAHGEMHIFVDSGQHGGGDNCCCMSPRQQITTQTVHS